jgi:hypothetical protein
MTLTPSHAENIPLAGPYQRPLPFQLEELR